MSVSRILHGDCLELLATLPDASIDACVTDPPYGIGFMGKEWDTFTPETIEKQRGHSKRDIAYLNKNNPNANLRGRTVGAYSTPSAVEYDYTAKGLRGFQSWTEQWAREVFRVLKPGAHAVVCGAPRAYHRMACGLEDAGFEIRDCLAWLFGSGFPKSLNLGEGLGTALKPAHEPIVLARKPFKGTVRANVERFGTGALNIDAARIGDTVETWLASRSYAPGQFQPGHIGETQETGDAPSGRWPANVALDEIAAMVLDEQSGELTDGVAVQRNGGGQCIGSERTYGGHDGGLVRPDVGYGGSGGASRFYYVAKPSREERDYGTEGLQTRQRDASRKPGNPGGDNPRNRGLQPRGNHHPTVKPVELMRWLVKLVTPINGTVLDPFTGSGTTGMACRYEQRGFIGIEREADYIRIAESRIAAVAPLFAEAANS